MDKEKLDLCKLCINKFSKNKEENDAEKMELMDLASKYMRDPKKVKESYKEITKKGEEGFKFTS